MLRAAAGLALLVGLVGGCEAAAQDAVSFPGSLDRDPLLTWLRRETDIVSDRVIAVTPQSLTAVVSTFPASGGQGPRAVIRAEALSAETFARTGSLSWHVSLTADCEGRRVRLGDTTGYARRNLLGEGRLLRAADTTWRVPEAGTALDQAWRAVCERTFTGPLQSRATTAAQGVGTTQPAMIQADAAETIQAAPTPTLKPAGPPPVAARSVGGLVAQIGASPSDSEAKSLLASLGARTEGRATWVEKAQVGGRTWFRAVVGGFAGGAEAQAFCAGLKAEGRPCFVRKPG